MGNTPGFLIPSVDSQKHACNFGAQMETWIDQTKQKLFDIIKQTKKEAKNLKLRVAFVGYVVRLSQAGRCVSCASV